MKRRKYMKFLSGLLCVTMLLVNLPSVEFLTLAAEVESAQETETQENVDAQEEDFENVSSVFEKDTYAESSQISSSEILEETESQTQRETSSEILETAETISTESSTENISKTEMQETETQETETQLILDADGNIASGVIDEEYGHITWVIDADGKLTVTGTGDFANPSYWKVDRAPWAYSKNIKSAEINVTGMTNASCMFFECINMSSVNLSGFDTSKVTNMRKMFSECNSLTNLNLDNFNTSNVTNMAEMFSGCSSLTNLNLNNFNTSNVTDMTWIFLGCESLSTLDLSSFDTSNVIYMDGLFEGCKLLSTLNLSSFNTSNATCMAWMFAGCSSLSTLDLSNFNTSNVTQITEMFLNCSLLSTLDLSNFNTSKVTQMYSMFKGCNSLQTLNLSSFDTSNVIYMSSLFEDCNSLRTLDLSNFNTSNVTHMYDMFYNCNSLQTLDLSNFDTSNVTRMDYMFANCYALSTLDLSSFKTSNATQIRRMFWCCNSLLELDLSNFNISNVALIDDMFYRCSSLTVLDLSSFDASNITDLSGIFDYCTNLLTLYAPYNLKLSATLPTATPTDKWYRSDGTVVTELPQNLSYSVALGKNHIPEEKEPTPTPDIEDESIKQLVESEGSIFQFFDDMTGAPIKNGQVSIDEVGAWPLHQYTTDKNGCVKVPLGKNSTQAVVLPNFKGYKDNGGIIDLQNYRSESGSYRFRIAPDTNKYKPKMPSVKASVDTSAPDIETSDGDISLLNMNMDFDLNFGKGLKSKVTYDKNDKTIKVALSTEKKLLNYDLIKHEFKSTKSKTLDEEWEKVFDEMQSGRTSNIDVKIAATGYLEYAESGDLIEGGITLFVKGEGTTTYRPACTGGVAYGKFKIGLSAEGKLVFTYIDGNIEHSGVAKLELYGTMAVGIGWKLAHAEIGATGKFPVKFTFPYKNSKESLSIDAVLEIYGETVLLCWGGKTTTSISRNIYPGTPSTKNASFNEYNSALPSEHLEVLPRNYLSSSKKGSINTYNTQKSSGLTSSDSFRYSEISTDAGVFEENNVQYVRLSNGTEILAWIHDFGDKNAVNRTTLVYSVNKNDGNGWSSITPVCSDTSTGDYYPSMTAQGNNAYLVWNKASSVFADDAAFDDVCKQIDVYVSVFDEDKFSEPQILSDTNNALMEFSPLIAVSGEKIAAAWLTNSVNDYHYTKGSNAIYVCEYKDGTWGSPVCYAQNLNYVSDYDVDYIGGQAAIVYAEDADNVSDTQDGTVYYIQNGTKTMIGDASYHAEIVDICDDTVYFSGGNKIYKTSGDDFSSIYDTKIETDNFSVVKSASGAEAVMFCKQDGFVRDVYVSYYRNGAYTSPVPIVADASKVTNYAPIYNNDGTISIAYNEEELLTDSTDIYGLTDMVIKKNIKPNVFFVDSNLFYDAYNVAPENTLEFSTMAYNHTAQAISQVNVTLTGSRSGELYTDTQTVDIPVGGQKNVSISYTLPETIISEHYTLTVTPISSKDIVISNNSSKCELGYSDIILRDLKIDNDTIKGTITNIGYQTAKNVSLTIKEDNEENAPLSELSYEKSNLAVGESWEFSQEITPTIFENVGDVKYYLLSAATDSLENNYGNDSATVYSNPVAATEISLDKNTLTLKEKTSARLQAEILPENATFKNAVYLSDANDIVAVDNDGNVYALKEGNAVVTAYTLDGNYSAQCEITVEGGTEQKYKLSHRGLELMVGDSSRLQLEDENGNRVENAAWSSTDESIVKIAQDGTVKTIGEGIALLTARIDDFVDVCMVRVSNPVVIDSVITLDAEELTIMLGEQKQLNATVTPSDAVIVYTSENPDIATVSETGLITGAGIGTTMIHAKSGNAAADCRVTVVEEPETQTFTVRFDTQGGSEIAPITGITPGSEISLPFNVTRPGYTFQGWYTQPNGGEEIKNTSITITESITLYAHWTLTDENEPSTETPSETESIWGDIVPEDRPASSKDIPKGLWVGGVNESYTYIGEAVKPAVRVYDSTTLLTEKSEYTIAYKNNINVGEATITVKGKGNYSGTETCTYRIEPADISGDIFYAEDFYVKIDAKKAQKPIPELYYMGTKLKNNKDFTITYSNASGIYAQEGTYTVTVTGIKNYTGTKTVTLTAISQIPKKKPVSITKAALGGFEKTFVYTGTAHKQTCTLTIQTDNGTKNLVEGADYTVCYANNIKSGNATVTYYGKNGYAGKLKKTYKILPYDIAADSAQKLTYDKKIQCVYAKGGAKPKPVVSFNGKALREGTDYILSYKNNKAIGSANTPSVTINGKGSFKGKITVDFTITPQELSKMTLVSCDKVYNGKPGAHKITPKLMDLDGKLLSAGKDFDKNNLTYAYETAVTLENGTAKQAGDAVEENDIIPAGTQIRVTFGSGTGNNYTGTFTGVYRIVKADIKSTKVVIPNQIYTGKEITPDKSEITVTLSGTTLKPEDYDIIQYTDNVKKGKASVTIKGKGNYGGTKTVKFTIGAKGFLWWWRKN